MTPEQIAQIEKIVEDVLKEYVGNPQQSDKQLLVLLGATQLPLDEALKQFQICKQNGWKIRIILSDLATKVVKLEQIKSTFDEEDILQECEITDIPSLVERHSQIVLPALAYPMVGKLALKLVDTPCTYLVYHALCCGKPVIASSESLPKKRYVDKEARTLDQIEPAHVNALREFGVQWITVDQIAETVCDIGPPNRVNISLPIISASVIANLAADVQELGYTKSTIITPLARDHAQKRGIKLTPKS